MKKYVMLATLPLTRHAQMAQCVSGALVSTQMAQCVSGALMGTQTAQYVSGTLVKTKLYI